MKTKKRTQLLTILLIVIILSAILTTLYLYTDLFKPTTTETIIPTFLPEGVQTLTKTYTFSQPEITENNNLTFINVAETDFHSMGDGRPAIPVNLSTITFPFGTKITDITYSYNLPQTIPIPAIISFASCSTITQEDESIYQQNNTYPTGIVTYHTGGGLFDNKYQTILNLRVYPVIYHPTKNEISYTNNITVTIYYQEPETPLLQNLHEYDLLIITPQKFTKNLQPLISYKNKQNIKTKLITIETINKETSGRDTPEKIKYTIKQAIEEDGITAVLLVGGIDGQSTTWDLPPRYSHVLIREGTQEIIEPQFLSDLYYADIYDSEGNFSSWDTNNNDIFAEYDHGIIDYMDLYPDVQLGRLPCRTTREVKIIVDKIISYETTQNLEWFKNLILVSGDHWDDENHISEGIEIMKQTQTIMTGFKPVELYATQNNKLTVRDINKAMNQGAGFAYFCGHGSPTAWGIHYPPNAQGWAPSITKLGYLTFYKPLYMNFLHNKNKLPITLVGGCNNGQFDRSIGKSLQKGKLTFNTGCWAWKLTIQKRGGSIATIANTGLGTHAMDDADNNGINDYLEVYDGWMELRFFELYAQQNIRILGQLHQETITQYLNTFLGNNDEMDIKMAQQWQLFGDPSLLIH
ncbi:MAG: hypothetical protein KKC68_00585 [Candidatus Thermoplasmatota archaeon]|nr:hypothetical protein [Candidatus Thermoplasmatota archaeon]MBU1940248.1 hypothetical protein [Candidatus Thermoplasmatota archaeon]